MPGTLSPGKLNIASGRQTRHMFESDEQLIAAVAAGDREAFAALYRRRRPDVFRFAMHMIGVPGAAEDVAQDVFMTVIHEARRYDPRRAGVVAWLLGIARNHARRRLSERRHEALPDGSSEPSIEADPADGLSRAQQTRALRRALATLPIVYREAIVLCDLQELTYEDAAIAAGCAIGTIRSRLHRGRTLLARRVRSEGDGRTGSREGAETAERRSRRAAG